LQRHFGQPVLVELAMAIRLPFGLVVIEPCCAALADLLGNHLLPALQTGVAGRVLPPVALQQPGWRSVAFGWPLLQPLHGRLLDACFLQCGFRWALLIWPAAYCWR
jgi:hypothetical protein